MHSRFIHILALLTLICSLSATAANAQSSTRPCPSGTGPGGITAGSYPPQNLTQDQRDWLYHAFGHTGTAAVGYGGEECGKQPSQPAPPPSSSRQCPSGTGPGGITAGSYPPQNLTQDQRDWLYHAFGHSGVAPVGYGGEECGGYVPWSPPPQQPQQPQSPSQQPSSPQSSTYQCPSGTGPDGITAGSYPPQNLTQDQRDWLYHAFGHNGTAAVGYGGEECAGHVQWSPSSPQQQQQSQPQQPSQQQEFQPLQPWQQQSQPLQPSQQQQTPSQPQSSQHLPTTSVATSSGPAGYTYCASEGQRCNFSGTKDVAYGANSQFNYKTGLSGGWIDCNNFSFGDPSFGVVKACYTKDSIPQTSQPQVVTQSQTNSNSQGTQPTQSPATGGDVAATSSFLRPGVCAEVIGDVRLNVREAPGLDNVRLKSLTHGSIVKIIGGPIWKDGYTWWQHDDGGWSVEAGLSVTPCSLSSPPTSLETTLPQLDLDASNTAGGSAQIDPEVALHLKSALTEENRIAFLELLKYVHDSAACAKDIGVGLTYAPEGIYFLPPQTADDCQDPAAKMWEFITIHLNPKPVY